MLIANFMAAKTHAQTARAQLVAMKIAQDTPASDAATRTLAQAAAKSQDQFAKAAAAAVSSSLLDIRA